MDKKDKGSFIGKNLKYGSLKELEEHYSKTMSPVGHRVDIKWRNLRPICPYGCDEEGTLLEIVVEDGRAWGIYTHSGDVKPFRAELQMAPKPTTRKIVIGPDGEPTLTTEESV